MIFAILLPQQLQRQVAMSLQLLANSAEVRHPGPAPVRHRARRAGHGLFQLPFVPFWRQWPTHSGRRGRRQVLVYGTVGDQATAGDLPLLEPEGMESKNLFQFSHAEPCLRQSDSSTSSGSPVPPAQLAELLLMKRVRAVDHDSNLALLLDRHDFGTLIDITSES
jgi:hypothetical protein